MMCTIKTTDSAKSRCTSVKKLMSIIAFTIFSVSVSIGQTNDEYEKALTRMFEASGAEESYKTVLAEMFKNYKDIYPEVDVKIWDRYEKEFMKTSIDDLVEMLVPVYAKYLTLRDVEDLTAFYQSRAGKILAESTPLIMKESIQIGGEWGLKLGQKIELEIEAMRNK